MYNKFKNVNSLFKRALEIWCFIQMTQRSLLTILRNDKYKIPTCSTQLL